MGIAWNLAAETNAPWQHAVRMLTNDTDAELAGHLLRYARRVQSSQIAFSALPSADFDTLASRQGWAGLFLGGRLTPIFRDTT